MEYSSYNVNTPQWREITVGSHLPAELRKLAEIAHNLWWTWNDDVKKLYCDLDPGLWKEVEQNPVLFLERINYEKLVALAHDENFVYKMDAVYSAFKKYVDVEPDHQRPSILFSPDETQHPIPTMLYRQNPKLPDKDNHPWASNIRNAQCHACCPMPDKYIHPKQWRYLQ